MPKIICLRGLPGSGKSTAAFTSMKHVLPSVRVNRDDIRASQFGGEGVLSFAEENLVTTMQRSIAATALKADCDVIVDDTNLRPKYLREWNKLALEHGADFETIEFPTRIDICIARDHDRVRTVGEDVIRRMASQYMPNGRFLPYTPIEPETVPSEEPYANRSTLPPVTLVDIDGTVALMGDRDPYDETTVSDDLPNWPVVRLIRERIYAGHAVIFLSGRSDACRAATDAWLCRYFPGTGRYGNAWSLLMRKAGDSRKDSIVKREIFDAKIRDRYHVTAVFDDRNQVVAMWRSLGLPVFQVADGNF